MRKYISFGYFNKKYFIIFIIFLITGSIEFFLISYIDKITKYKTKIRTNKLLGSTLTYIGQFLCFIPLIISKKYNSNKLSYPTKNNKSSIEIKYIFKNSDNLITFKDKILIIVIYISLLINDIINILISHLIKVGNILFNQSFYFMEYLLLFLISKFIFKLNYYKHQNYSIIFIILFGLLKYLVKLYTENNLKNNYKEVILVLMLQIIHAFIDSYTIGNAKILMESKYLSPYFICSTIGLVNGLISIISYFFVTYTPCSNNFCELKYNNKYYFDNIYSAFDNISSIEIFLNIYTIFQSGIYQILIYIVVNDFTVCHIFLFYQVLEFADTIVEMNNSDKNIFIISLLIIIGIFEIFIVLVLLEIIELGFCGLNYNTKKNIKERALNELNLLNEARTPTEETIMMDE